MYTRAYPPPATPIPEGYSGVALRQEVEEDEPIPERADEKTVEDSYESPPPPEAEVPIEPCAVAVHTEKKEPSTMPSSDLLLLALAALLLQGGRQDSELVVLLLLLLLWD